MFDKKCCYNGGNKHKFEARYTEEPNPLLYKGSTILSAKDLKDLSYIDKYVYDICVWCGKTVRNEKG
jgi:hypothetical protein